METKTETKAETSMARRSAFDFDDRLIEPFAQLRNEVDRLFDGFPLRLPVLKLGRLVSGTPAIDMSETKTAYKITAELPGIDADDVQVTIEDGTLRIAGEKREQREEEERGYRLSERSYGSFERMISLPPAANAEKIKAKVRNGILTVTVAKDGAKQNARTIKVDKQV
jgi:HSP20 family protein